MTKETNPPRKGPGRMRTAQEAPEQMSDREVDATIRGFAEKAHNIIQKARGKMTPEQRERADRNANAILEDASAAAKRSQRRA
jgi:vacuolar-type H+-ATPase subunit H